jgi:uncharacterized membrane protein
MEKKEDFMFNWAHIHLMINHFPVVGVMGAVLLLLYALVRKSEEVKLVSLGAYVLVALITIPVYVTGGYAEDAVKNLPGVTEKFIGQHEDIAFYALILMETLGILALAGLLLLRRSGKIPQWVISALLVLSLITTAVIGFTANLGGQIRHTEIRADAPSSSVPGR